MWLFYTLPCLNNLPILRWEIYGRAMHQHMIAFLRPTNKFTSSAADDIIFSSLLVKNDVGSIFKALLWVYILAVKYVKLRSGRSEKSYDIRCKTVIEKGLVQG